MLRHAEPGFIADSLKPYSWYKGHVLAGACKHGLRSEYVSEYIKAIADPNEKRYGKEGAALALH